jgi:hypothetical protein
MFNIALIVAMLVTFSVTAVVEADSTESSLQDKGLLFLRDIVGLDLAQYDQQVGTMNFPSLDASGFTDEIVKYNLTSTESKIDVICIFRNDILVWCKLYTLEGSPMDSKISVDPLSVARNILDRYQSYSKTSDFSSIQNMFDTVKVLENDTITVDDINQVISIEGKTQTITWSKAVDGIENNYNMVQLTLRDGEFEFFCNKWDAYSIGNTNVNLSQEDAIEIAKQYAQAHSWVVDNQTVSEFTILDDLIYAKLSMQNRENNTLYPHWEIQLPLDQIYPGGVTNIEVLLWADTGKVSRVAELGAYGVLDEQQDEQNASDTTNSFTSLDYIYVIITLIVATSLTTSYLFYKRRR